MAKKKVPYVEKRGDGEYPWRVRWPTPRRSANGRIIYDQASGFATADDAYAYGEKRLAEILLGISPAEPKTKTFFADWAETWMAAQPHSAVTATNRRKLLRRHLLPEFGAVPLSDINRWMVRTWATRLTCARSTAESAISLMSTILTGAAEAGLIDANPIQRLRLSTAGTAQRQNLAVAEERVWAYPEQAVALAARCMRPVDGLLVLTAAFTGMRYGELAALHRANCGLLRRAEIDGRAWTRHVIRIDPDVGALHETSKLDDDGVERSVLYLGAPKPPNGAREIDLPPFLADLLAQHLAHWQHEYVFPSPMGRFWRRSSLAKVLRPVCDGRPASPAHTRKAYRDAWEPLIPGLELHGLRHGHKTAMEEDGVAAVLQDEQMGHGGPRGSGLRDSRPVQKRYTHVTPTMRKQRLDALTARWEKTASPYAPKAA